MINNEYLQYTTAVNHRISNLMINKYSRLL